LLADYKQPADVLGENGLLKQLAKVILERVRQVELLHHPGDQKHDPAGNKSGNPRNGKSKKPHTCEIGALPSEGPPVCEFV